MNSLLTLTAGGFSSFVENTFGNGMTSTYLEAIFLTLKITLISTLASYLIGIPLGVILYCTSSDSLFPNKPVNAIVGFIVNILRSVPFIIYLIIAAAPFVARMIESSFKEVDTGVIEAAQSMGSTNMQIIRKVLIPEAMPSLIIGSAIAITTILGYTPMTYLIGGGGLGQVAVEFGLHRFNSNIMYFSSVLLIVIVQIMQVVLSAVAKRCDKRIRKK